MPNTYLTKLRSWSYLFVSYGPQLDKSLTITVAVRTTSHRTELQLTFSRRLLSQVSEHFRYLWPEARSGSSSDVISNLSFWIFWFCFPSLSDRSPIFTSSKNPFLHPSSIANSVERHLVFPKNSNKILRLTLIGQICVPCSFWTIHHSQRVEEPMRQDCVICPPLEWAIEGRCGVKSDPHK